MKFSRNATGGEDDGRRRGGGGSGSLGSNKNQMLNHLAAPKISGSKSCGDAREPRHRVLRAATQRLEVRGATHHSRLNGRQQSRREGLGGERLLPLNMESQANISRGNISGGERGNPRNGSALNPTHPPTHLNSQNQFIGKRGHVPNGDRHACASNFLSGVCVCVASGFITTSDLISFSYASKSQVRRAIGMMQGE